MTITRARLRRMARRETIGVDVAAAVSPRRRADPVLGPALLVPVPVAIGYGDSPWPFVLAAAVTTVAGSSAIAAVRRCPGGRVGARGVPRGRAGRGCSRPVRGHCRTSSPDEPQLSSPLDALFRGDVRVFDDGRERADRDRGAQPVAAPLAPVHPVAWTAWGSSCSRPRCSPACASAADSSSRRRHRPRDRAALGVDPRHGPSAVGAVRLLTVVCATRSRGSAGPDRPEMDLYDAVTHAPSTLPTADSRPTPTASAFGRRRRNGSRSSSCSSTASTSRCCTSGSSGRADRRPRRGAARYARCASLGLAIVMVVALRHHDVCEARRRSGTGSSRPSRSSPPRATRPSTTRTGRRSRRWRSWG